MVTSAALAYSHGNWGQSWFSPATGADIDFGEQESTRGQPLHRSMCSDCVSLYNQKIISNILRIRQFPKIA